MADTGATLQATNNELVKVIEDLRERREETNRSIQKEEEEKARIINELKLLNDRLGQLDASLGEQYSARAEYDKAITETERAFSKIVESSRTLLTVLKRETGGMNRSYQPQQGYQGY